MENLRIYVIKFRDGTSLQTLTTDLPITVCIETACIKANQTVHDVVAAREVRGGV